MWRWSIKAVVKWPSRKLGNLGNLGNIIPSFLISEFSILLYSQNRKLGFKNLGKDFRDFRGFRVFDLVVVKQHWSSFQLCNISRTIWIYFFTKKCTPTTKVTETEHTTGHPTDNVMKLNFQKLWKWLDEQTELFTVSKLHAKCVYLQKISKCLLFIIDEKAVRTALSEFFF